MTSYAAPAVGVLCVELLKQLPNASRQIQHPTVLDNNSIVLRYTIPRSKTIQNLTLFVGFLDWIQISEPPSSDVCSRIRQIVSRVLDELLADGGILENRTKPSESMQAQENGMKSAAFAPEGDTLDNTIFGQEDPSTTMIDFGDADLWNFELMDTYGWIES